MDTMTMGSQAATTTTGKSPMSEAEAADVLRKAFGEEAGNAFISQITATGDRTIPDNLTAIYHYGLGLDEKEGKPGQQDVDVARGALFMVGLTHAVENALPLTPFVEVLIEESDLWPFLEPNEIQKAPPISQGLLKEAAVVVELLNGPASPKDPETTLAQLKSLGTHMSLELLPKGVRKQLDALRTECEAKIAPSNNTRTVPPPPARKARGNAIAAAAAARAEATPAPGTTTQIGGTPPTPTAPAVEAPEDIPPVKQFDPFESDEPTKTAAAPSTPPPLPFAESTVTGYVGRRGTGDTQRRFDPPARTTLDSTPPVDFEPPTAPPRSLASDVAQPSVAPKPPIRKTNWRKLLAVVAVGIVATAFMWGMLTIYRIGQIRQQGRAANTPTAQPTQAPTVTPAPPAAPQPPVAPTPVVAPPPARARSIFQMVPPGMTVHAVSASWLTVNQSQLACAEGWPIRNPDGTFRVAACSVKP